MSENHVSKNLKSQTFEMKTEFYEILPTKNSSAVSKNSKYKKANSKDDLKQQKMQFNDVKFR